MNISDFTGDALLEQNGVWRPFEDAKFLIAAAMNPAHKKALNRLGKANQRAIRLNDDVAQDKLAVEAMAEGIVLGWENVTITKDDQEVDFPYTKANAITLMTKSRVMRDWISGEAQSLQNFQKEKEAASKEEIKSSPPVVPPVG